MMIADDDDTHGQHATHPTVAHRIAGSMVFNAPSAPRSDAWAISPSLVEAEAAALPRVASVAPENALGLTRWGMAMTVATLGRSGSVRETLVKKISMFSPAP